MRITFLLMGVCSLLTFSCAQEITRLNDFFSIADKFFKKNVEEGSVDYQRIVSNKEELNSLVKFMEQVELDKATTSQKKAFWINAYNLTTIKSIVAKYPIESPLKDENFFTGEKHKVAGEMVTLNDIEQKKLLEISNDPRVHFVIVCAAKGCPKLASFAYEPGSIEQQIVVQTKKVLNDSYFIRVNDAEKKVEISEIFKWYEKDFTANGSVLNYINQYRDSPIPPTYTVSYYTYDWSLNEK